MAVATTASQRSLNAIASAELCRRWVAYARLRPFIHATLIGLPAARLGDAVAELSGGNQQKAFVGRCLGRDDVFALLMDEPTRGVDIGGRAAIHHLLRRAADAGLVVMFASTELDELLELGDVIVTMRGGRLVNRYEGDVDGALLMRDMTQRLE